MRRNHRRRLATLARRALLLVPLLSIAWVVAEPRILPPAGPIASNVEGVDTRFTLCGDGGAHACVVDGDQFRLGARQVRLADAIAPEAGARCEAESGKAAQSRQALLDVLNQGPFTMVANRFDRTDAEGHELRRLVRDAPDGTRQSIGAALVRDGHARAYRGTFSGGWC